MNDKLIKELRARTHLGMTECKKALEEAENDLDKAIEILSKKGLKKVDDLIVPLEGVVKATCGNNIGFIVEINCQTDFGAKSEVFQTFVDSLLNNPDDIHSSLESELTLLSNQLGEKIVIRRFFYINSFENSKIFCYNHPGNKIAVLLNMSIPPDQQYNTNIALLTENIAMQIAAVKPLYLNKSSIPEDILNKKKSLLEEEVANKPEKMRAKIVEGKLQKWFAEVCLVDQVVIWEESKKTIKSYLDDFNIKIELFIRYERGEVI